MPRRRLDLGRIAILGVVALGTIALLTKDEWDWLLQDGSVQSDGVTAPALTLIDGDSERLYRIGTGSSVSYAVEERLAGSSRTAVGTTPAVAGDIAVNIDDPTASRIGTIVVNIEMFGSDSNLRDRRLRHDFLESTHHPFAEFAATEIELGADAAEVGQPRPITIAGDLTVKTTTLPTTFRGHITVDDETLSADLGSTVQMSDFGIGPIHIAGLVHTADDVDLDFSLRAERVDSTSRAAGPATFADSAPIPGGGAFAATVMPILEQNCAGCHSRSGPGRSTVALDTASDAAAIADDIALVTSARYMPPWPANDAGLPFIHDASLTDDELATIAAWAAAGGGLDIDPATPLVAATEPALAIERDAVVVAEPYEGVAGRADDFRCQVYEIGDPATERWIRGVGFEADATEIVHHAAVSVVAAREREKVANESALDERPGWDCEGFLSPISVYPISTWAPGAQPLTFPPGAGMRLAPGDFIVVQIHYHYDHETPVDQSILTVDLASDDDIAAAGGSLEPVEFGPYFAPAEVPCRAEERGPLCDRDAVARQLVDRYGVYAGALGDGLVEFCGETLERFIADTDGVADARCDQPVRNAGRIISIWPHMHEFGATFRMTLNPGTPEERILLEIPEWSFEWQLDYRPAIDVELESDDVIRLDCTWDRSLAEQPEPRYITWNMGTGDEMCLASIGTLPVD